MARKTRRIPNTEPEFNTWYQNFAANIGKVAEQVGVDETVVARVVNDSKVYNFLILYRDYVRTFSEQCGKVKKKAFDGRVADDELILPAFTPPTLTAGAIINPGIEDYANLLVQRIVKHHGCTPEIEALLDIALSDREQSTALDELRTAIKELTAINGGVVNLRVPLMGKKAYRVFCRRGTNEEFEHLYDSTESKSKDKRPNLVAGQPEKRSYKVILLEKNEPVGQYSAIETVVTMP